MPSFLNFDPHMPRETPSHLPMHMAEHVLYNPNLNQQTSKVNTRYKRPKTAKNNPKQTSAFLKQYDKDEIALARNSVSYEAQETSCKVLGLKAKILTVFDKI